MITIMIPTALRAFADNQAQVEVEAGTVGSVMGSLTERHPGLRKHLFSEQGKLRNFVNLYLGDEDIRYLQGEETPVTDGDTLSLIPAIAGGLPVAETPPASLSHEEVQRYSRHLIVPEVGMEGQLKLKAARVLLIGAGGLGSPAALYLAAAGVGTIGMVDFDVVDSSNLQRQVIHGTEDVGRPKLDSARDTLLSINPNIEFRPHEILLDSSNALEIFQNYDIVVDGTDNFQTRYLVNDACVLLGKPNVYGSIFRFEGQASVFWAEKGPCYRCLYAEPPPPGLVPSCAEGGVLGILPGVIGTIQATETVKLILGKGEPLIGRWLLFDALGMRFRELKLRKDLDCPICGEHPTIHHLIDYNQFCGITPAGDAPTLASEWEITPRQLKTLLGGPAEPYVLDVRSPEEWQIVHLPQAHLIPLGELPARVQELDASRDIVVHCKSGVRSAKALQFLRDAGFSKVKNLQGGITAWAEQIDPSLPTY